MDGRTSVKRNAESYLLPLKSQSTRSSIRHFDGTNIFVVIRYRLFLFAARRANLLQSNPKLLLSSGMNTKQHTLRMSRLVSLVKAHASLSKLVRSHSESSTFFESGLTLRTSGGKSGFRRFETKYTRTRRLDLGKTCELNGIGKWLLQNFRQNLSASSAGRVGRYVSHMHFCYSRRSHRAYVHAKIRRTVGS